MLKSNVSYTLYFSTYSSIVTEVVKYICPLEFLNNPNYFLYIYRYMYVSKLTVVNMFWKNKITVFLK